MTIGGIRNHGIQAPNTTVSTVWPQPMWQGENIDKYLPQEKPGHPWCMVMVINDSQKRIQEVE